MRIKVTTTSPTWPLERQTPGSSGVWQNCRFFVNQQIDECDFWVVYDDLLKPESAFCPPDHIILVTAEPPAVKTYSSHYVSQFKLIITCHPKINHPNVIYNQQALPWHVGRRQWGHQNLAFSKDYDELVSIRTFQKDRLISVITSDKTITPGHRKRVEFVRALSRHFSDRLDVFGRGINEIEDKWDAIYPYKYHVVLENSSLKDYWTEKLADAYLAGAFPFYLGCTNLEDYFPKGSYIAIPSDPSQAIRIIENSIENNLHENSIAQLAVARDLVLNRYNLFALVCDLCNKMPKSSPRKLLTLYPTTKFRRVTPLDKAKDLVSRLTSPQ